MIHCFPLHRGHAANFSVKMRVVSRRAGHSTEGLSISRTATNPIFLDIEQKTTQSTFRELDSWVVLYIAIRLHPPTLSTQSHTPPPWPPDAKVSLPAAYVWPDLLSVSSPVPNRSLTSPSNRISWVS